MNLLKLEIPKPKFINEGLMFNIISNMQTKEEIINKIKDLQNYEIVVKNYHKKPIAIKIIGHINIK